MRAILQQPKGRVTVEAKKSPDLAGLVVVIHTELRVPSAVQYGLANLAGAVLFIEHPFVCLVTHSIL